MQQIWTLQYFFCEQYHHIWQILLILCKSHVVSLKTHQFQFPNYSVFYPRYLIFPIHWFKIHKTLSFYYPENLTPALFFVNRFLSSATKPKTLLSSFFIFPSLHLTPHFPFLYLYEAVPVCDQSTVRKTSFLPLSEAKRQGKQRPHSSLPQITSLQHNTHSHTHKPYWLSLWQS